MTNRAKSRSCEVGGRELIVLYPGRRSRWDGVQGRASYRFAINAVVLHILKVWQLGTERCRNHNVSWVTRHDICKSECWMMET